MPELLKFILLWLNGVGVGLAISSLVLSSNKKHRK